MLFMAPLVKRLVAFGLPLVILLLPTSWLPLPGLTIVEQRVIALFVFAALSWILEAMPVYATSVSVVVLELFLVSDNVLAFLKAAPPGTELGTLIPFREIMATFASPIILLFLGGFFLAMAATKYQLDLNLARVMLKPFGTRPSLVLLGLMVISGVFSM